MSRWLDNIKRADAVICDLWVNSGYKVNKQSQMINHIGWWLYIHRYYLVLYCITHGGEDKHNKSKGGNRFVVANYIKSLYISRNYFVPESRFICHPVIPDGRNTWQTSQCSSCNILGYNDGSVIQRCLHFTNHLKYSNMKIYCTLSIKRLYG